jgi:O-succinylhomoserine sulfhydrylase
MSGKTPTDTPDSWGPATQAVRGGMTRSPFGETSEAMFLTQSFVYDSAEAANARFAGENPGYIYSRYANPTVKMFEDRLALMEGAEFCRSTASGMGAIFTALSGLVRAGDHILASRALFGSCRWLLTEYLSVLGVVWIVFY